MDRLNLMAREWDRCLNIYWRRLGYYVVVIKFIVLYCIVFYEIKMNLQSHNLYVSKYTGLNIKE